MPQTEFWVLTGIILIALIIAWYFLTKWLDRVETKLDDAIEFKSEQKVTNSKVETKLADHENKINDLTTKINNVAKLHRNHHNEEIDL